MGNEPENKTRKPQNRGNNHRPNGKKPNGRKTNEHAEKTFLRFGEFAWLCQRLFEVQQEQQTWHETAVQMYTDAHNGHFGWTILVVQNGDWAQAAVIARSIITGKICWGEGQNELTQKRLVPLELLENLLPLLKRELHTLMPEKAEA